MSTSFLHLKIGTARTSFFFINPSIVVLPHIMERSKNMCEIFDYIVFICENSKY